MIWRKLTLRVTGIDVSETMVDYATKRAIAEEIDHVHLQVMNFQHLDVETSSFDFVNARFVQWFLNQQAKASIYQEWFRLLRPGGILRLIEGEIAMVTNSQTLGLLNHQFISALAKAGKTAVPAKRFVRTPLPLRPSLQTLECQDIHETTHLVQHVFRLP